MVRGNNSSCCYKLDNSIDSWAIIQITKAKTKLHHLVNQNILSCDGKTYSNSMASQALSDGKVYSDVMDKNCFDNEKNKKVSDFEPGHNKMDFFYFIFESIQSATQQLFEFDEWPDPSFQLNLFPLRHVIN